MSREKPLILFMLALLLILSLSAIHPYDRLTWLMEVAPVLIALPVMAATYRRFPLTTLLYVLIFIHALILIAGGAYTYARVPLAYGFRTCCRSTAILTTRSAISCKALCPFW